MARSSIFVRVALVLYALLASACAQVAFTNGDYSGIAVGSPFTIKWSGDGTVVTIKLRSGPAENLQVVQDIATGVGSAFTWTPGYNLAAGTYALSISQSGKENYSPKFAVAGATGTLSVKAPQNTGVPAVTPSPQFADPSQDAKAAPTPAYVASGGLTCGNATWPYYATANGTGFALPTGTNTLGQYAYFKGAASERALPVLAELFGVAVLVALVC